MLGLEKEIRARKLWKSNPNEKFSCWNIANLLGRTYTTIDKKLKRGTFTIEESLAIFKSIIPAEKQTLDYFIYLFTEQN